MRSGAASRVAGTQLVRTYQASVMANILADNAGAGLLIYGDATEGPATTAVDYNDVGTNGLVADGPHAAGLGNAGAGISILKAGSVDLTGNRVDSNGAGGIVDSGGDGLRVYANSIGSDEQGDGSLGNRGAGVLIGGPTAVSGVDLLDNIIGDNGAQGVIASDAPGIVIAGNFVGFALVAPTPILTALAIEPNGGDGIEVEDTSGARLSDNQVAFSGGNGIEIGGQSDGTELENNVVGLPASAGSGNLRDGILISARPGPGSSSSVVLSSETIAGNAGTGLDLYGAEGVSFGLAANTIAGNGQGIEVQHYAADDTLDGGTVESSLGDGIHVSTSVSIEIGGGIAVLDNGAYGIEIGKSGDITIGDVTIRGNAGDAVRYDEG